MALAPADVHGTHIINGPLSTHSKSGSWEDEYDHYCMYHDVSGLPFLMKDHLHNFSALEEEEDNGIQQKWKVQNKYGEVLDDLVFTEIDSGQLQVLEGEQVLTNDIPCSYDHLKFEGQELWLPPSSSVTDDSKLKSCVNSIGSNLHHFSRFDVMRQHGSLNCEPNSYPSIHQFDEGSPGLINLDAHLIHQQCEDESLNCYGAGLWSNIDGVNRYGVNWSQGLLLSKETNYDPATSDIGSCLSSVRTPSPEEFSDNSYGGGNCEEILELSAYPASKIAQFADEEAIEDTTNDHELEMGEVMEEQERLTGEGGNGNDSKDGEFEDQKKVNEGELLQGGSMNYAQHQERSTAFRLYVKECLNKQMEEEIAFVESIMCTCSCPEKLSKGEAFPKGDYVELEAAAMVKMSECVCESHKLRQGSLEQQLMVIRRWRWEEERGRGGVRLLQRLYACAEAVACRDARQAGELLVQVRAMASPYGDSLQRVASCFAEGLGERLELQMNDNTSNLNINNSSTTIRDRSDMQGSSMSIGIDGSDMHRSSQEELKQEALRFMCDVCPYVTFGHFVANSAIYEAMEGEQVVHVVDLGMEQGLQWEALLYELARRPGGAPRLVRITAVGASAGRLEAAGAKLRALAAKAELPRFEFRVVAVPSLEALAEPGSEAQLGVIPGAEAVAVNSMLQLHTVVKESRGSLNAVLRALQRLRPKVLTLAEQDAPHNGPFFLGRFHEALQFYCRVFDSLQAVLPRHSTRRAKIEHFHLAPQIRNIVACEGPARVERHERVDQWRRRMSRAGFVGAPLRHLAPQARIWLARFAADEAATPYTVADDKGCLVLGWKGENSENPIIEELDKNNYPSWKLRVTKFLIGKGIRVYFKKQEKEPQLSD